MKVQKIYIDTSVFGGYYDEEFEEYSKLLFERIYNGDFTIIFSSVTERELINAPLLVKELSSGLPKMFVEYTELTNEVVDLAKLYIEEKVVGKTSFDDCLHIAIATILEADYLVSWNFKHIVNVERIRGYNYVNIKNGYKIVDIRSPRELIKYEE
jgi:predicted nucleic acid-binding protein